MKEAVVKDIKSVSFTELTHQVNLINDLILTDLACGCDKHTDETNDFRRHLISTKFWFCRVSWPNKKRFVLALLHDVTSAWTISLILKSIWNCRPKSAYHSLSEPSPLSTFDEVPMDHNRTAIPIDTLVQVMKSDRLWFIELDPEPQAKVITELLTVSGGPIMWAVLSKAMKKYEEYRKNQLDDLRASVMSVAERGEPAQTTNAATSTPFKTSEIDSVKVAQARKHCEDNIMAWNAEMKLLRDTQKLEEVETILKNGTVHKVWKVNRPRPEAIETVDLVQQLPSEIGKRILSYLPRAQLPEYAKVNKYWAYLVDEFRAEQAMKLKLQMDYEKLQALMMKNEPSSSTFSGYEISGMFASSDEQHKFRPPESFKFSQKSGAGNSYKLCARSLYKRPPDSKPVRNMAELTKSLDRRGAADENVWKWCKNVLKINKTTNPHKKIECLMDLGNTHFVCPLMQYPLHVPLEEPLLKDPTKRTPSYLIRNISNETVMVPSHTKNKKICMWDKDFSRLYSACKIPAYQMNQQN